MYSRRGAELEGFSRPLWGLVPLAAGGGQVDWEPYRRGLANGTDPDHEEYWGRAGDVDQRLVEMAAIGFGLALVPEHIWEPLDERARQSLGRWLGRINEVQVPDNNWLFFRVMVNEGLGRVGSPAYDPVATKLALDRLESFYLGDGWYADGQTPRRDYYVAWAMHFYGLVYARLARERDPERSARFRGRAAVFAHDFAHWFAPDGGGLPFGRSLTYRFAQGAFWGALAFADVEALAWPTIKGLALRHLRWWWERPITDNGGVLSVGYGYPNLTMAEGYNAPGSPYWAMKFFLPLELPETHPFWRAAEAPAPDLPRTASQPRAGMIVCRDGGHVFALTAGQYGNPRHGAEKYAKFAYSSAFGFSVPAGQRGLEHGAHDSMLALSDDGTYWRVRDATVEAEITGDGAYSRWSPWPDVEVETWLLPYPPWHVRVHRLRTERPLHSAEGGYALDRSDDDAAHPAGSERTGRGHTFAAYPAGRSGIRDLLPGDRGGEIVRTHPNTNLLFPRAVLPTLRGRHRPGEHWLACAVLGALPGTAAEAAWDRPPRLADVRAAAEELSDLPGAVEN